MKAGKARFEYKRPDSTDHFHFRRKVASGKNAGQWTGCPFGASKDEGVSTPFFGFSTISTLGKNLLHLPSSKLQVFSFSPHYFDSSEIKG